MATRNEHQKTYLDLTPEEWTGQGVTVQAYAYRDAGALVIVKPMPAWGSFQGKRVKKEGPGVVLLEGRGIENTFRSST